MGVEKGRAEEASSRFTYLAAVLLFVGACLRVGQYTIGAALWMDELALARNVVDKPVYKLLTEPLDYFQTAPPGFLLIEKAAVTVLGNNEYALRLFPLLCALASLLFFADFARRIFPPEAALVAIIFFSLSVEVTSYGSQVKQYSTDVAAALLMAALTLRCWERRRANRAVAEATLLGTAGFLAVWFSHAAVLVLAGLSVALLFDGVHQRDRATLCRLVPIAILWGAGALGAIAAGLQSMSPSTHAYMQAYWAGGFMPLPPWSADDVLWLWMTLRRIVQYQLRYPLPPVGVLLMLVGAVMLARRRFFHALVILAPLGVTLLASAARQYPFRADRVLVFLLPGILLLIVEAIDQVRRAAGAWWRPIGATIIVLTIAAPMYALYAYYPVYPMHPMPDVLAYVQSRRQRDDAVYVYYGAWQAVGYYGSRYSLPLHEVVIGACPRGDPRRLLNDLDQFRGHPRLWVIISHVVGPFREHETIRGYLNAIGVQRDSIITRDRTLRLSSSAYLYDLSDAGRLRATSAETYKLPAREHGVREFSCTEGPMKPPDATTH